MDLFAFFDILLNRICSLDLSLDFSLEFIKSVRLFYDLLAELQPSKKPFDFKMTRKVTTPPLNPFTTA